MNISRLVGAALLAALAALPVAADPPQFQSINQAFRRDAFGPRGFGRGFGGFGGPQRPATPGQGGGTGLSAGPQFGRGGGGGFRGFGGFGRGPLEVEQFEKLELVVDLKATFKNPYDPDDVDLWGEFTAPSGKVWKIWGFFNPGGNGGQWMMRFAAVEPGQWKFVLKVHDREGDATSDQRELNVTESERPGFVKVAANGRYFEQTSGSSFYPVGLWFNDNYERYGGGNISEESLDELQRLGVNFISFYPSLLETHGTGLGRYDQNISGRLDQVFEWCEARDIRISWNLVFHSQIAEDIWGPGNSWYVRNPYRSIAEAKDFMSSDDVWTYEQKLNRYIIARWGYSRSLFLWFVIDEINGTESWTEGDRDKAHAWCEKMRDFFHDHDPYGRPTTGTQSGGIDQWWPEGYEIFDVAAREIYESQGFPMPPDGKPEPGGPDPLTYSYKNYAKQVHDLWTGFEKPAIVGESGWDLTYYEPGMPGYLATYHNALWASLANGSAATPFWWAHSPWRLNDSVLTGQVQVFSAFASGIDFAGREWAPIPVKISSGDAWGMRSEGSLFGWAVNPNKGIAKEVITIEGLADGEYVVGFAHTWHVFPPLEQQTVSVTGGKLTATVPVLISDSSRGQNMGDDVAFKIERREAEDATASASRRAQ